MTHLEKVCVCVVSIGTVTWNYCRCLLSNWQSCTPCPQKRSTANSWR